MNTSKIYNDPILFNKRKGIPPSPFKHMLENLYVENGYVLLREIPNRKYRVEVSGGIEPLYEIEDGTPVENTFKVDYVNGEVHFHESMNGENLNFKYLGEGVLLFPDSRVWLTADKKFNNVRDKFIDIDRGILNQKNRVDELIRSTPQPSEIVDARVDRNGKVFSVLKDRIDSEQEKIEDAYIDLNGIRHDSLKARIDFLHKDVDDAYLSSDETNLFSRLHDRLVYDYNTLDGKILDIHNRIGNVLDEARKNSAGFNEDGTFNVNYLKGVISESQLESAKKWNAYGTYIDQEGVYSGLVMANQIIGGSIHAGNGNTEWNLNTGDFSMGNANFTLSGGAMIEFVDSRNKLVYERRDTESTITRSAGVGFGNSINSRFPLVYMGAVGTPKGSFAARDDNWFSGFIANTTQREATDGIGNSVIGYRFHIRDKATSYSKGWEFDLNGNNLVFRPINGGLYNYDLGTDVNTFNRIFVSSARSNTAFEVKGISNNNIGWRLSTAQETGRVAFRGLNGGSYNYDLGSQEDYNAFYYGYISHLRPSLSHSGSGVGSSDRPYVYGHIRNLTVHENLWNNSLREYKDNIEDLDLEIAINFVKHNSIKTYNYKGNEHTSIGLIRDELIMEDDSLIANETAISPTNVMYMNQRVTQYNLNEIEKLKSEVKRLKEKLALIG